MCCFIDCLDSLLISTRFIANVTLLLKQKGELDSGVNLLWFTLLEVWNQTLTSMDFFCVSLKAYSVSGVYSTGSKL